MTKLEAFPMAGGRRLQHGAEGICEPIESINLAIWESLHKVGEARSVYLPMANSSDEEVTLEEGTMVGTMRNLQHFGEEATEISDVTLAGICEDMGKEPSEPKKGPIRKMPAKEEQEFRQKLIIKAPNEWKKRYEDLMVEYNASAPGTSLTWGGQMSSPTPSR